MKNKLIISKANNKIISSFFENNKLIELSINSLRKESILDNIYVGKVQNIVKNINAAFIEIENGLNCYYSLGENKSPIMDGGSKQVRIGDEIIVQVKKESVKTKAPVVSSNIEIVGKYLILIHGKSMVAISSKIKNKKTRHGLNDLVKKYKGDEFGFIVRTNAAMVSDELVIKEIQALKEIYFDIKEYGPYKKSFSLIYEAPPVYISDIRDAYSDKVDEFITDDLELYDNIEKYLKNHQKEDLDKLRFYDDKQVSLNALYGISDKIDRALKANVWLKSGASIIIQATEALTVVDVNTGKAIAGKRKAEDTFLKINLEAAKEIGRQIRIRNISGIIIIDFIDMKDEENNKLLMVELDKILKKDPITTNLIDMTPLGLVEITRKKIRKPLHEQIEE